MAYTQTQKILSNIATADDDFGKDVVIDGYHMAVSSYNDEALLYKRNIDGDWVFRTLLSGEGVSICMNRSFIVVSDSNGTSIRIFDKDSSDGTVLQQINEVGGVEFGGSVAINNDDCIVVADQSANTNKGEIFIYERTGTNTWTAYANNPVTADVVNTQDFFGSSVSINDDSIIVGAKGDNNKKGAVYIFQKDLDTEVWEQTQKLFASDGLANDQFGESVSASGDFFVVGASLKDNSVTEINSGAAYIFKYSTSWFEIDKLTSIDESDSEGDHFGESVYINGDHIIVGSPNARSGKGVADVFYKKRSWGHLKKIVGSDTAADDNFGTSVSISGRFISVGSPNEDTAASNAGAVYIYEDPPVRLRLAQEFEVNSQFIPSKASTYLKRVGENTFDYWPIYNTQQTVIDTTNFSTIDKEENRVIFNDTISGFTGNGYMILNEDNPSISDLDYDTVNYPIRAINPDTYNLWIRCINTNNNNLNIEVLIDGNVSKTISTLIDNPSDGLEWSWVNTTLVLPDNREHVLGIRIKENNVAIDKIYIDVDNVTPYTEGPDLSISPYLTVHMKVYDSLKGEPGIPLYMYDYKNSITEVIQDDWYNFDINVLDDTHGYTNTDDFSENYYLVMSVSGSNTSNFVTWELVDNDEYNAPSSAIRF